MDGRLPVREEKKERRGGRARQESERRAPDRGTHREAAEMRLERRNFRRILGLILALLLAAGNASAGSWHTLTEMEKAGFIIIMKPFLESLILVQMVKTCIVIVQCLL